MFYDKTTMVDTVISKFAQGKRGRGDLAIQNVRNIKADDSKYPYTPNVPVIVYCITSRKINFLHLFRCTF